VLEHFYSANVLIYIWDEVPEGSFFSLFLVIIWFPQNTVGHSISEVVELIKVNCWVNQGKSASQKPARSCSRFRTTLICYGDTDRHTESQTQAHANTHARIASCGYKNKTWWTESRTRMDEYSAVLMSCCRVFLFFLVKLFSLYLKLIKFVYSVSLWCYQLLMNNDRHRLFFENKLVHCLCIYPRASVGRLKSCILRRWTVVKL